MVLVPGGVDPEVVVVPETVLVREQQNTDRERTETELVIGKHLESPANRASAMADAELERHNEHVAGLFLPELVPRGGRLGRLTEMVRAELPFAPVLELAAVGQTELVEDDLHRLAIGRGDELPARNGTEAFLPVQQLLVAEREVAVLQLREQLTKNGHLVGQRVRLAIAGQVAEGRGLLFVLVPVGDRQVFERAEFFEHLLDGIASEPVDLLDLTGSRTLSNCVHALSPLPLPYPKRRNSDLPLHETSFLRLNRYAAQSPSHALVSYKERLTSNQYSRLCPKSQGRLWWDIYTIQNLIFLCLAKRF